MYRTLFAFLLCLPLFMGCQTTSDTVRDLEAGETALAYRSYERAARIFRPLAQSGDPKANHYMGYLYDWGYGVGEDDELASAYYTRSA